LARGLADLAPSRFMSSLPRSFQFLELLDGINGVLALQLMEQVEVLLWELDWLRLLKLLFEVKASLLKLPELWPFIFELRFQERIVLLAVVTLVQPVAAFIGTIRLKRAELDVGEG